MFDDPSLEQDDDLIGDLPDSARSWLTKSMVTPVSLRMVTSRSMI